MMARANRNAVKINHTFWKKPKIDVSKIDYLAKLRGWKNLGQIVSDELKRLPEGSRHDKATLNAILRGLGQLAADERPTMGALANELKDHILAEIAARRAGIQHAMSATAMAAASPRRIPAAAARPTIIAASLG